MLICSVLNFKKCFKVPKTKMSKCIQLIGGGGELFTTCNRGEVGVSVSRENISIDTVKLVPFSGDPFLLIKWASFFCFDSSLP